MTQNNLWEASEWKNFFVLLPRNIEGRWHWLEKAERRTVYVGGAMGACLDMWRTEYRMIK